MGALLLVTFRACDRAVEGSAVECGWAETGIDCDGDTIDGRTIHPLWRQPRYSAPEGWISHHHRNVSEKENSRLSDL